MISILFVCHGNICRSPMAEFILKDLVQKAKIDEQFYIESAATSREEIIGNIGNPVYPPARYELLKHGIDCGEKRARQITPNDYARFDYIFVMDQNNYRNSMRIFGDDYEKKISLLMTVCGEHRDVADPWYTGDFSRTYSDISRACTVLFEKLTKN